MSGWAWAVLAFIGGLGITVTGDMVSEEVRDRLDHIPRAILKLAAGRLDPGQRSTVYVDEWLPELTYILKGAEARPITRLITGTHYALGILASTRRIARHLRRSAPGQPALAGAAMLQPAKAEGQGQFWNRYRRYLEDAKLMPLPAVRHLDEATDRVLGLLGSPDRDGTWRRCGFVATRLESGKTDNYIGLACKAASAGFKLIVVLTANLNLMWMQTQMRVEEGFLGLDTQYPLRPDQGQSHIGGGGLPGAPQIKVISLTTSDDDGDFGRQAASRANTPIGDHPVVLVCMKNPRILEYVQKWVAEPEGQPAPSGEKIIRGIPALVIDAEADDTAPSAAAANEEPRLPRANPVIRHLLESFEKRAYVGYRITPFANTNINPDVGPDNDDGIFSSDFNVSLGAPPDYLGPERLSGIKPDVPDQRRSFVRSGQNPPTLVAEVAIGVSYRTRRSACRIYNPTLGPRPNLPKLVYGQCSD